MDIESEGLITQQPKANGRRPVGSSQNWTRYGVLLPSQQTRKLKEWVLTDQQQKLVNASGLGHLALTAGFTIDRSLLTAFLAGHVVAAEPVGDEAVKRMCLHYLGESPGHVTPNATTQFLGSATLLMAWIYEYLPTTQPQQKNQSTLLPRACQWNFGGATHGQRKKVMEWRKTFEQLQFSEVNWNPYRDINPAIVPEYCIAADNICYSRTWLISFNIKEVYVPDRFARQFGREQGRLHGVPMWARRTWKTNITALPPDEPVAEQNAAGYSLNPSKQISAMVEDLKNDLPIIDRYLEEQLLPVKVSSFLERVSTMIKSYSAPQNSGRKDEAPQGPTGTVRSKNPRKRGKLLQFQDPSSPQDARLNGYAGALVPHQASKCNMLFDGTVPLLSGGEGFKEQGTMGPCPISQLRTSSSSSPESSSLESSKRRARQQRIKTSKGH
ncbi:hypothetical protein QOZ80_7AG0568550 [Eleusine coracana subsp. coracana]|nr:hypothetical protein QOZ80_7AG0568550 [Eleusine coracana subsp. coracana]